MPLYGGIDLHANNSVVVLLNDQDQVIYYNTFAKIDSRPWASVVE
jgi:hypothetical protein